MDVHSDSHVAHVHRTASHIRILLSNAACVGRPLHCGAALSRAGWGGPLSVRMGCAGRGAALGRNGAAWGGGVGWGGWSAMVWPKHTRTALSHSLTAHFCGAFAPLRLTGRLPCAISADLTRVPEATTERDALLWGLFRAGWHNHHRAGFSDQQGRESYSVQPYTWQHHHHLCAGTPWADVCLATASCTSIPHVRVHRSSSQFRCVSRRFLWAAKTSIP